MACMVFGRRRAAVGGTAWVPDHEVAKCLGCARGFSLFLRRHHCRACGCIFCNHCSQARVPVPPYGLTRVCDGCISRGIPSSTSQVARHPDGTLPPATMASSCGSASGVHAVTWSSAEQATTLATTGDYDDAALTRNTEDEGAFLARPRAVSHPSVLTSERLSGTMGGPLTAEASRASAWSSAAVSREGRHTETSTLSEPERRWHMQEVSRLQRKRSKLKLTPSTSTATTPSMTPAVGSQVGSPTGALSPSASLANLRRHEASRAAATAMMGHTLHEHPEGPSDVVIVPLEAAILSHDGVAHASMPSAARRAPQTEASAAHGHAARYRRNSGHDTALGGTVAAAARQLQAVEEAAAARGAFEEAQRLEELRSALERASADADTARATESSAVESNDLPSALAARKQLLSSEQRIDSLLEAVTVNIERRDSYELS